MGRTHDALRAAEVKRATQRVAAGGTPPTASDDAAPRRFGSLVHRAGRLGGTVHGFASTDVVMIGRGRHNDIRFDLFEDPTVSTCHAEIRFERGRFVLYDLGSLNGTYLNGHPIRRTSLTGGDEIGLGRQGPVLGFEAGDHDVRPRSERVDDRAVRTASEPVVSAADLRAAGEIPSVVEDRRLERIERAVKVLAGVVAVDVIIRTIGYLR